ncbi:phosphoglucosamine mutase [Pseudothermotoga thermarum]|uniref:Phosphoglucosamine mutase n=1 Tax=Pseudothermotoga thermarum DSM 5069 TaxID=688269 RepID=F7YVF4_9THEM|nr:phosphoglucosamine mutase [Pseudothermotoga thermarum]AEH50460.1 phosphoglucosamine mutase [Pseudothermotoga thermarum DSM 5069]
MSRLFGTDGIRGIFNQDLTEELAYKVGKVLGQKYSGQKFLIVRDTRESGEPLQKALVSGLMESDLTILLAGVLPTPAAALLTKKLECLAVVISASHNPYQYNGIKILKLGYKLPDEEEDEIQKIIENLDLRASRHLKGKILEFPEAEEIYVQAIKKMYENIDFRGLKIAVDAANGSAYKTTPRVLRELGLKVDVYANNPDGRNINDGCGSLHPSFLARYVYDYDLGILHDGDADRCILLTPGGKEINGDKIMGITAVRMKQEGRLSNDTVVGTIMSNVGLESFLTERGIKFLRTKVGDKYVLEKMLEVGANLGGERSGHIIFLDRSTTGDGLITALEFLSTMVKLGKNANELEQLVLDFPQVMINVEVEDKSVAESEELSKEVALLRKPGYRIVIRPSGTEKVIRIMVEGPDEKWISATANHLAELVKSLDSRRG